MKALRLIQDIAAIVPEGKKKTLKRFLLTSLLFSLLDLVSIAYLVPVIMLLLDRERLMALLVQHNVVTAHIDPSLLALVIIILVIIYGVKNVLQARYNTRLYEFLYLLSHQLSMQMITRYLNNDFVEFQQQNKADLLRNVMTVTRDFAANLLAALLLLASESITLLVIVLVLLHFYFWLTFGAIAATGIFALLIYRIKRKEINLINTTYKEAASEAGAELLNIIDGYLEIKTAGSQQAFLDRFRIHHESLNRATSTLSSSSANYSRYLELFLIAAISSLLAYNLFISNRENLLLISILAALSIRILPSLSKILNSATIVNSHLYSIGILKEIQQEDEAVQVYSEFKEQISLSKVSFSYPGSSLMLEDLSFFIQQGEMAAIHGITGAGKTTLLHILSGLIPTERGSLVIDGHPVEGKPFLSFCSYVSQQPFLFNGTILENITMRAEHEATDIAFINKLSGNLELNKLFNSLPKGIHTQITHNTSKLSGGQKQRIALLRALYNKPQLLILDEATNQQNEQTENMIYKFISELSRASKMAVVVVSHNNVVDQFCDGVYLLEQKKLRRLK
ncbi:MAG TPA: ABC transporter ATP-binding protein [Flavobacterium sp.]|jgi:ABC-type bacteriocin/lantibiotic exporter with double-glycine peptidase domain